MADHPLQSFYQDIHSSYDRVNRVFTFGRDRIWRKKAARTLIKNTPAAVLDLCTGTGDLILEIASMEAGRQIPLKLTGYDFTAAMLQEAEKKYLSLASGYSGKKSFPKVRFIEGDAANMPFKDGEFEALGITFGLRNLIWENEAADRHLSEINRVLSENGSLVVLESSSPASAFWRFFNNLYLSYVLPLIGAVMAGNRRAYSYLGTSSRNYYTRSQMSDILANAGFRVEQSRSFMLGSVMLVAAVKEKELGA